MPLEKLKVISVGKDGNQSEVPCEGNLIVELGEDTFRVWFDTYGLNRKIVIHGCNGPLQVNPLEANEVSISHASFKGPE